MADSLKKQAAMLTLANGVTRGLGFLLRLVLARSLGAESMGVLELASSAGMLALTPVTAGIPTAMSRLTARHPDCDQPEVLRAGLSVVSRSAWLLMPIFLLLSPGIAALLGDQRTLPALAASAPCILLLGLGSVYGGYCYGRSEARIPARNECIEQAARFTLTCGLLFLFAYHDAPLKAALPVIAEGLAALLVLLLFRRCCPLPRRRAPPSASLRRQVTRLALPTTMARLCATGMRALNAVLLPVCLRRSGLSVSAATAQFGLLTGMAMPLMLLPGIITGAISMVAAPAITRHEHAPARLTASVRKLYLCASIVGLVCGLLLFGLAKPMSQLVYRQPALAPLIRLLSPLAVIFSVHQVQGGIIAGLGCQRRALTGAIVGSLLTLIFTALMSPLPGLRLYGACLAMLMGQSVHLLWNAVVLRHAIKEAAEGSQGQAAAKGASA